VLRRTVSPDGFVAALDTCSSVGLEEGTSTGRATWVHNDSSAFCVRRTFDDLGLRFGRGGMTLIAADDRRGSPVLSTNRKSFLNSEQETTSGFHVLGDPHEGCLARVIVNSRVGFSSFAVNVASDIGSILLPTFAERATLTEDLTRISAPGTVLRVTLIFIYDAGLIVSKVTDTYGRAVRAGLFNGKPDCANVLCGKAININLLRVPT
jgi:hypothetical protein